MELELYPLRVFCRVMELGTFSAAAEALRLSQPTVSQQIAGLERSLKTKLFQRVGHKVVPTADAEKLFSFARELLSKVTEFEEGLSQERTLARGLIRYGMPESCQWTPHYRQIMAQIGEFPHLEFRIAIQPGDVVSDQVLRGELDFGFIVGDRLSPDLRYEKFGEEEYCLVTAHEECFSALENSEGEGVRWIRFPGSDVFFQPWARVNRYKMRPSRDRVILQIGTLAGAIHAVEECAGMAVVPRQCVAERLKRGQLFEWRGAMRASSSIYIVKRMGEALPHRVELVLDLLRKAKKEIG